MIRRLIASRFRSLGQDVTLELGPLTVLVGQNGAGKSNLVDAFVFLADCVQRGLEVALGQRGGIQLVRYDGARNPPDELRLRLEVEVDGVSGHYEIVLGGDRADDYQVRLESAAWGPHQFEVRGAQWQGPADLHPHVDARNLALPALAGDERFAPLASAIRSVAAYNIRPDDLRKAQRYDPQRPLDRTGSHWLSTLRDLPEVEWKPELVTVLHKLAGVADVKLAQMGPFLVLHMRHDGDLGARWEKWIEAAQESDGTLRMAGMMTALLQRPLPALLAFEEPELTIHPGALALLHDYLQEAAMDGQVLLTTHSPDLVSMVSIDQVRVVERIADETRVAAVDAAQQAVVVRGLFSLGDVMRSEGLRARPLPLAGE